MSGPSDYQPTNPALKWLERRLPIMGLVHSSFVAFPVPRKIGAAQTHWLRLFIRTGRRRLVGIERDVLVCLPLQSPRR